MPNYFCQFWSKSTFESQKERYGRGNSPFNHIAGNDFRRRGVLPFDVAYVYSFFDNTLYLVGRMDSVKFVSRQEAREFTGGEPWDADDQLISTVSTKEYHDLVVPKSKIDQIEFISPAGELSGVVYFRDGAINWQTFRSVRRITEKTAQMFDALLEKRAQKKSRR